MKNNVLRACAVADKKEDLSTKPETDIEQARCYAPDSVSYDKLSQTLSFNNGDNFHISPSGLLSLLNAQIKFSGSVCKK